MCEVLLSLVYKAESELSFDSHIYSQIWYPNYI
jgi:hypothetical protein